MRKSKKILNKKNKTIRNKTKCIYTDEAKILTFTNCTFGGKRILWRGITVYESHPPLVTHSGSRTIVDPGGSTFFLEGNPVAFEGDSLQDGDKIAPLAGNTSYGG